MSQRSLENTIRQIQHDAAIGDIVNEELQVVAESTDLEEGAVKRKMEDDAESMSKADFIKKHGKDMAEFWEDMNEAVEDKDEDEEDESEDKPLASKKKKKEAEPEADDSEEVDESVGIEEAFTVEVPKQSIGGKTIGGGKGGVFVKAKTARQAIQMVARKLGVDFTMLKVGKVVKEGVEHTLEEAATDFFKVSKDILKLKDSVDQKYINKIGKLFGDIASNSSLQKRDKSVLAIKKAMRDMDTDSRDAINDVLDAHNLRKGPNLVVDHVEMDEAKRKFEPSAPSASAAARRKAIEKHQAKRGKKDDYDMDDDKPKTKRVKGKYGTSHYDESVSVDRVNESSDNRFSRLLSNAIKKKS